MNKTLDLTKTNNELSGYCNMNEKIIELNIAYNNKLLKLRMTEDFTKSVKDVLELLLP